MNKYTILKWEKLLLWLIPPILRKKTHADWLNVLLSPIRSIYEETLYKMQHTGQVIYLEKILNETFNPTKNYDANASIDQKRVDELIYIDESVKPTLQYVYLHKEYYEPDYFLEDNTRAKGELLIPQLKIYTHPEYKYKKNKPVYLAHLKDYTSVAYANFRVFIPESLINNGTFIIQPNNDNSPAAAIKIANIEFHNLLNFYKLAGKSYETYAYSPEVLEK
ncbi:hypothetical protein C8C83_3327 [Flavobacterium sp. 90]|uniref:hypothetical protein n=1 Tax=unclassified Flavobacterium TaxID=196869 RepID=UPI000EABD9E7|nr:MULTISPECIES: hypothetical protein [unclassified Flavobacterium]RKR11587.1 hypothetical protein C8C82_3638 [Flavobacterium sp. 81]TCK55368.1 hypothetical protein C8C83_3327 [Flavobacterium sp. 90]